MALYGRRNLRVFLICLGLIVLGLDFGFIGIQWCSANSSHWPKQGERSVVYVKADCPIELPADNPIISLDIQHFGAGFALNGHILTCDHVIHGATSLTVTLRSGKVQPARILKENAATDLAELGIDILPPSLKLRGSTPRLFERVWQCGHPANIQFVWTTGWFLTFDRDRNLFDLETTFGDSGAPIMDRNALVVGMTHGFVYATRFTVGGTLRELQEFIK